ncbi:MAG: hypothetical protein ACK4IX_01615 [Candidatus Sericytochromatia bacterium]
MENKSIFEDFSTVLVQGEDKSYNTKLVHNLIEIHEKTNKKSFSINNLESKGRLKTLVLHKSYSYEHLIESKETNGNINNGIVKDLCISSSLEIIKSSVNKKLSSFITHSSKVWKVSLGYRKTEERIYKEAKKNKEICVGWLENESLEGKSYDEIYIMLQARRGNDEPKLTYDATSIYSLTGEMKKGDFVCIYDDKSKLTDIGIVTSDYFYDEFSPYPHKRKISWLKEFKTPIDLSDFDKNIRIGLKTIYELNDLDFAYIREILDLELKNNNISLYYLILENIEKINLYDLLGEFSYLIKKENRDKNRVVLMNSKKTFSIPPNLIIIGTFSGNIEDKFLQDNFKIIST